jgi:hypothetical protein
VKAVVHLLVDENVAQRIDVRRRHAVERDTDEIHRRFEPDPGQHAVVTADDHHVQRRIRILD